MRTPSPLSRPPLCPAASRAPRPPLLVAGVIAHACLDAVAARQAHWRVHFAGLRRALEEQLEHLGHDAREVRLHARGAPHRELCELLRLVAVVDLRLQLTNVAVAQRNAVCLGDQVLLLQHGRVHMADAPAPDGAEHEE